MTAIPRPNYTPGSGIDALEQWMTDQLRTNPGYRLPQGYSVSDDGTVQRDEPNFLMRNPWIFPASGVGVGALSGLLGGGAAAAGFSESGVPTTMGVPGGSLFTEAGVPTASGLPSGSLTLASRQTALPSGMLPSGQAGAQAAAQAAAQGGSWLSENGNWLGPILGAGVGLLGRVLTPTKNTQVQIPPELQQLLAEATRRTMNQGPLSDAITKQALASLPRYAR